MSDSSSMVQLFKSAVQLVYSLLNVSASSSNDEIWPYGGFMHEPYLYVSLRVACR